MLPINQVILGGGDPLLGTTFSNNIDEQLKLLEKQRQVLEAAKQQRTVPQQQPQQQPQRLIWDEIDAEVIPMTEEQKSMLFQDEGYADSYNKLQSLVQTEILNLVKGRIESSPEGRELLEAQLKIVRKLKGKIIETTNREMELFRKFREFSKAHPDVTYEEFVKSNM